MSLLFPLDHSFQARDSGGGLMDQSPLRAVERSTEVSLGTTRIEGALPFPSSSGVEESGLGVTVWVKVPAPGTGDKGGAQVSALGAASWSEGC